jgi:putative outer membrane protein
VRLKNLQLGYDFKYKLLKNVSWLSSAKVSLVGTNLLTFSDVSDWLDPEQSETQNWAYPMTKTYSIMVSLGF